MPLIIDYDEETVAVEPGLLELMTRVGEELLRREGATAGEVSVLLVDDEAMRELNSRWRGIDAPTDVLSFSLREGQALAGPKADDQAELLGDVVISLPRARAQAEEYGHRLERELAFLLSHGLLHLFGYDHQTAEQEQSMRARQEEVLAACGEGAADHARPPL